jgi:multimeric flavodoxin WrbA
MKVIGINASPKGKNSRTLELLNGVLDGAKSEGAETECLDLYNFTIKYCNDCGVCYAKGECTLDDDFSDIFDKMMDADGIVLGSPNYISSVSAPMKAMFDRMADAIHCQMFYRKYGCSVCTGGGNYEEVLTYMNKVLTTLGANVVGGVGVAVGINPSAMDPGKIQAYELGKMMVQSIRGENKYPEQEEIHAKNRAYFGQLVKFNKDKFEHEYDWYVRMGWME